MKGWACEAMIIAGAYLLTAHPVMGSGLLVIGILLSGIRFGIGLGQAKIRDDLLTDIHKVFKQLTTAAAHLDIEKFREKQNQTVH